MLKGVNKSVIEISCTDSGYFERAILFVKPEQSFVSAKRLQGEAKKYIDLIDSDFHCEKNGKKVNLKAETVRVKRKKLWAFLSVCLAVIVVLALTVLNIL